MAFPVTSHLFSCLCLVSAYCIMPDRSKLDPRAVPMPAWGAVSRVWLISESQWSPPKGQPCSTFQDTHRKEKFRASLPHPLLLFCLATLCSEDFHGDTTFQISISHPSSSAGGHRTTPGPRETNSSCALVLPQGAADRLWCLCPEFLCSIATLLWTLWLNFMDEF